MTFWIILSTTLIAVFVGYMAINKTTTPYEHWTRKEFQDHLLKHENIMNMSLSMQRFYMHTIHTEDWQPEFDFNGCSVVQDKFHPCPDCWAHDYLWFSGQGGRHADRLFLKLMLASGMKKGRARWRYVLVRIGWLSYYKWRHLASRNVNEYCTEFVAVCKELKIMR